MPAIPIAAGVARLRFTIANVYFVDSRGSQWALVDSGAPGSHDAIRRAAEARYGPGARPAAILLTHGHSDHAGSAAELARLWDVPVYAHGLERPFLTGRSAYPPKDPTVGGFMGLLSRFLPSAAVNLGAALRDLPEGEVPGLPEWTWRHTPGHAPGHVVFFQAKEKTLLAGDAITTMDLDSFTDTILERRRICRPPAPFTFNWRQAHDSVETLARLRPLTVGAGHGAPMSGPEVAAQLYALARRFPIPHGGRYSAHPARTDESGVRWTPPPVADPLPKIAMGVGAALAAGTALALLARRANSRPHASRAEGGSPYSMAAERPPFRIDSRPASTTSSL
jgi:glyoxylase-like metal-dependent hydrolase (beta-lactamase superfamily II)